MPLFLAILLHYSFDKNIKGPGGDGSKQASLESFCLEDRVKREEKEDQDTKIVCVYDTSKCLCLASLYCVTTTLKFCGLKQSHYVISHDLWVVWFVHSEIWMIF